ncbi:hypothetical protein TNCV_3605181 [Trichonephila clavipes]|uniref:Uncharacterized protein n=1 Tax=Trichonephila clavipes TaxID=2585209 RepID=A0A8X6RM21_TRICX|nr:hypothetical protein TNCV_3605181 [Trichonephila clavipes]
MQDDISVIPCSCRPRAATTNLSNSCTCGLERFPSARNDTLVDSELSSYTGDGTSLLQLSDLSSTCEVVQLHEGFDDGPCHFEPWSSDVDDTCAGTPSPNYHTTPTGGGFSSRQI